MNPLPCIHLWEFIEEDDVDEPYFECWHCHKQMPYCPEDLADVEEGYEYD